MSNCSFGIERKKAEEILKEKGVRIHFLGILGAGMSPLAELLVLKGYRVTGTDRDADIRPSDIPKGAHIMPASSGEPPRLIVYSLAVPPDDPELLYAVEQGIPTLCRAELLGAVMLPYPVRIGVSGTHGKSTVTAIFDTVLSRSGLPHTTVSGAKLPSGSALNASGDGTFLFEACEYRNSFLSTSPTVAVVTNIELDHADFFRDEEHFYTSFECFASSASDAVLIGEGRFSDRLASYIGRRAFIYGESLNSDFSYSDAEFSDTGMDFSFNIGNANMGRFHISAYGIHNVKNAVAVLAYCSLFGISLDTARDALSAFHGIERRLELLGYIDGRAVYYDYAHHPTEIECSLRTLKEIYGHICCIFRPHTFSRTASFLSDFGRALRIADSSVILDIYPAREAPIEGISAERLQEEVGDSAVYLGFDSVVPYVLRSTEGAVVLMGAGEVEKIKKELSALINKDKNKRREI